MTKSTDDTSRGNAATASESSTGEDKTILLVEDEETVRKVIERLLHKLGYEVESASDAEEAIEIFTERNEEFDLVLTDVVMPGLTGVEMSEVLRKQRPDMKFLFTSGYTSKELGGNPEAPPEPFLPKPFSMEELSGAVRAALE
ncbi:MAG: response regulator [Longimicrobiales bacterium]|nr:response regulator [Longimicrobiales bacterium]